MKFTEVLSALNEASSFELFRLRAAIDTVLDDPMRMQAIQSQLKPGQVVEFFNARANANCRATVIELRRKVVLVMAHADTRQWLIDYAAINLDGVDVQIGQIKRHKLSRNEVSVGDTLGYLDRNGRQRSGKVIRLNDKTVTMQVEDQQWRVSYGLLHRIMEADVVEQGSVQQLV
jgi:hypothetical protein